MLTCDIPKPFDPKIQKKNTLILKRKTTTASIRYYGKKY